MMQHIGRDKVGLEMVMLTKNTLWDGVSKASVCEPFRLRAGWNGMDVPLLWPLEQMIYQDFYKRSGAERSVWGKGDLLPKILKSLYFLLKNKKNSRTFTKQGGAERLKWGGWVGWNELPHHQIQGNASCLLFGVPSAPSSILPEVIEEVIKSKTKLYAWMV